MNRLKIGDVTQYKSLKLTAGYCCCCRCVFQRRPSTNSTGGQKQTLVNKVPVGLEKALSDFKKTFYIILFSGSFFTKKIQLPNFPLSSLFLERGEKNDRGGRGCTTGGWGGGGGGDSDRR